VLIFSRSPAIRASCGLNALIEAARAGERSVKVRSRSLKRFERVSSQFRLWQSSSTSSCAARVDDLVRFRHQMVGDVRGTRVSNLALNMIRHHRSQPLRNVRATVRWWATDSAVVDWRRDGLPPKSGAYCSTADWASSARTRYTVLSRPLGRRPSEATFIRPHGRPGLYPAAGKMNVRDQAWFSKTVALSTGGVEFVVDDVSNGFRARWPAVCHLLHCESVKAARATVRLWALAIFFDWGVQSKTVVDSVSVPGRRTRRDAGDDRRLARFE